LLTAEDVRGQWWIHVYLIEANIIRVVHKKREQSSDFAPEKYFEFEWNLMCELDASSAKLINASLYIADIKVRTASF